MVQIDADSAEAITYLHTDHLNTPRLATNTAATVIWRWEGQAFGVTAPDEDPDANGLRVTVNLRFPGQYYDAESGLHYNWHRYYNPMLGRYITSDPIGLDGGSNTYLYANANPLRFLDPTGQAAVDVCDYLPPKVCSGLGQGLGKGLGRALGVLGLILSLSGDTLQECDDDDIDCDEWVKLLNKQYVLIKKFEDAGGDVRLEKRRHNKSVGLMCQTCGSPWCEQAKRF